METRELAAGFGVSETGMWVEPTVMPWFVSSLVRDSLGRIAFVFASASGIRVAPCREEVDRLLCGGCTVSSGGPNGDDGDVLCQRRGWGQRVVDVEEEEHGPRTVPRGAPRVRRRTFEVTPCGETLPVGVLYESLWIVFHARLAGRRMWRGRGR